MSESNQDRPAPGVDNQQPAGGAPEGAPREGAAPAGDGAQGEGAASERVGDREPPRWFQHRLARYARQREEISAERDAARRELEAERQARAALELQVLAYSQPQPGSEPAAQAAGPPPPRPNGQTQPTLAVRPGETPAVALQRVQQEERQRAEQQARQQADVSAFNAACDVTAGKISAQFGAEGLSTAAQGWREAGLDYANPAHFQLIALLNTLPDGHVLYHTVGNDPELAERIIHAPTPMQSALELARLRDNASPGALPAPANGATAVPVVQAPVVSQAPAPPPRQPSGRAAGNGSVNLYDDKAPTDAWIEARNRQRKR